MSGGDGLRGRVLVIDGGSGRAARRFPPREARPAPALTRILAAIAPQVLLATDGVDSVLLPSAVDADTVRDHLRAAARHPGPLLVHIGGHLVRDRRSGALALELDHDRLPWRTLEEELRLRPMQSGTLVIGDLSAEAEALPQLRVQPSPLGAGLPLWAAVNPDATQVGTFTRALVEALHGGRPGAGERLTPEQLQQQVHTVLRPETQIVVSHAPGWQVFRNTSRRLGATLVDAELPLPAGPAPSPAVVAGAAVPPMARRSPETVTVEIPSPAVGTPVVGVPVVGVPAVRPHGHGTPPADVPPFDMPPLPSHAPTAHLTPPPRMPVTTPDDLAPYRIAISAIVAAADAGEHARAVSEAIALERTAVSAHGTDSEPVLKLRQVRAHVTRLAGLQREATLLYRDVALSLLDARGADDPETRQAAANAEACWRAIEDDADARRLGPDLVRLRQALPDPRRLSAVSRHLSRLRGETPPPRTPEDAAATPLSSPAPGDVPSVPGAEEDEAAVSAAAADAAPAPEDPSPGGATPEEVAATPVSCPAPEDAVPASTAPEDKAAVSAPSSAPDEVSPVPAGRNDELPAPDTSQEEEPGAPGDTPAASDAPPAAVGRPGAEDAPSPAVTEDEVPSSAAPEDAPPASPVTEDAEGTKQTAADSNAVEDVSPQPAR